jgi:Berberine and berberine like
VRSPRSRSCSASVYPNFPDPELIHAERAYHGANYLRLRQIKAAYDPDLVFSCDPGR